MKLHRRELRAGGRSWTVLTPRPGSLAAFSTNRFHETWHLVSDPRGARLLARLLWGLAFQRRAGTLILLHDELLRPTPFDAERSDPIVLANTHLGVPRVDTLRALRRRLPAAPAGTLRWQTWGLDARCRWRSDFPLWRIQPSERQASIARRGGCILYAAPPDALRLSARLAQTLDSPQTSPWGDYQFFVSRSGWPEGELQTFDDYRARVSVAVEARREVLADEALRDPRQVREAVWSAASVVARRRRAAYRRRATATASVSG